MHFHRTSGKGHGIDLSPKYQKLKFGSIGTHNVLGWGLGTLGVRSHFIITSTLLTSMSRMRSQLARLMSWV